MQQVFAGGGSNLFAVRIAGGTPAAATLTVPASTGNAFLLTARSRRTRPRPRHRRGSWGNDIRVVVVDNGHAAPRRGSG